MANVKGKTKTMAIKMVNPGIAAATIPTSVPTNAKNMTFHEKACEADSARNSTTHSCLF
jgi:hypothetical protein